MVKGIMIDIKYWYFFFFFYSDEWFLKETLHIIIWGLRLERML